MSETLPANLDAERAVLGGILMDNNAYIESTESLGPKISASTLIAGSIAAWLE